MKKVYHYLISWIPFILLFALATYGLEVVEGDKIRTTEFLVLLDMGPFFPLFIGASVGAVLYPITFLPFTILVNHYVQQPTFKRIVSTLFGGVMGGVLFKLMYPAHYVIEYNLSMVSAILIFGVAGFLFSLAEMSIRRNIRFE